MNLTRLISAAVGLLLLSSGSASAASCPTFVYGLVLTAAQWQACFDAKQNVLPFQPLNRAGDSMLGPLGTVAPNAAQAGFNAPPGTAPTSPNNGDIWTTPTGLYVQINGATVGPLIGTGGAVNTPIISKTANYTLTSADVATGAAIVSASASGGAFTIIVPPTLGTSTLSPKITIIKTDTTSNQITISDGTNAIAGLFSPATAVGQVNAYATVVSNGTNSFVSAISSSPVARTAVLSATTTAPPGSPSPGDTYIVPAGASGAWTGWAGSLTVYTGTAWARITPQTSQRYVAADTGIVYAYNGSFTALYGLLSLAPSIGALDTAAAALGVQAQADINVTLTQSYCTGGGCTSPPLSAIWASAGGIITQGSFKLTFVTHLNLFPFVPMFNPADSGLLTVPVGTLLTPYNFGAVGDGVADDTASLVRAFATQVPTTSSLIIPTGSGATTKHPAYFLSGVFLTSAQITMPYDNQGWQIDCDSKLASGIYDTATTGDAITFTQSGPSQITMKNCLIWASAARTAASVSAGQGSGITIARSDGPAGGPNSQILLDSVCVYNQPGSGFNVTNLDDSQIMNSCSVANGFYGFDLPTMSQAGGIDDIFTNDRAIYNGCAGLHIGSLYQGYIFNTQEALGNNQSVSAPCAGVAEISLTGTSYNMVFNSPDTESTVVSATSNSTTGILATTAHALTVNQQTCNVSLTCMSFVNSDTSVYNYPTVGSTILTTTVTSDVNSKGNKFNLKAGQNYSITNGFGATNTITIGNIPVSLTHTGTTLSSSGNVGTPHLVNIGSADSQENMTGCNAASTIVNPDSYPNGALFTGTISDGSGGAGTILTSSALTSGIIEPGMVLNDAGGTITLGTRITSGSGTTWTVSASQNLASEALIAGPASSFLWWLNITSSSTSCTVTFTGNSYKGFPSVSAPASSVKTRTFRIRYSASTGLNSMLSDSGWE